MTSFSGVTFVLFCFVFVSTLSLKPRPFVQSFFDMISGANANRVMVIFPGQLTTSRIGNLIRSIHTLAICVTIHTYIHAGIPIATCVSFSFFLLFIWRCRFFRRFLFVWRVRRTFFSFRMVVFHLVTTGWIFDICLSENSFENNNTVLLFKEKSERI